MKYIIGNHKLTLLTVLSAFLLMACSEDSEQTPGRKSAVTVELIPSAQSYTVVEPAAFTRAWEMPEGYVSYSTLNGMFDNQTDLVNKNIGVFFTKNGKEPVYGAFFYSGENKWMTTVEVDNTSESDPYYLYGYIPYMSSVSASVAGNSTYSEGAVLTLRDLPSVTSHDVCVIVGARNGTDESTVSELTPGRFDCAVSGQGNYIFLLFNHLYSGIRFTIKVNGTYDALRTIKLKKLSLKAYNGNTAVKKKYTATIRLRAQSSPIDNIVFTPDGSSGDADEPLFSSAEGLQLSTTASNFKGSFVPGDVSKFTLVSTYDVYDKHDNLVRANCVAENVLYMDKLFPSNQEDNVVTKRGTMYAINLTVNPTYLYVLSDPDLDNPTVVVSN